MGSFAVKCFVFALFVSSCAASPLLVQQPAAADAGCAQQGGTYTCNWSSFKLAFERAHTIAVETRPMDRSTKKQVDALVQDLGKTEMPQGGGADLTMLLIPVEPSGLNLGPGDHDLATLRVYAPGGGTAHGALLWAETLRGQGDRPWPAQVHAVITQFQDRFTKR